MIIEEASRIKSIKEYYFSKKLREIDELKKKGIEVINLGIGSPDLAPPNAAVQKLISESQKENSHSYQSYKGIITLRKSIANWYDSSYKVKLSESEVLPLIGSKEGIFHISLAFLNEGDHVLIPNPGYPAYNSISRMAGAIPLFYELNEHNNWQPDFDKIEAENDLSRVKIMWVNYPNMPTGVDASYRTFKKLIQFGKKHNILICNDNPYSFILNNNPKSILEIENAKEICIELNSLSKSHNMAGWRLGMIAGKKTFIEAILKVSSNINSGMYLPIQKGAIEALSVSKKWYQNLNLEYSERRKIVFLILEKLNCTFDKNQVGMFVWAKISLRYKSGEEMSNDILKKKHIFITPGFIFGSNGEQFIRISLCNNIKTLTSILERLK